MPTSAPATPIQTPDGRRLDLYTAGPADGKVLLFHSGTPAAPLPFDPIIELFAARGLRYVAFARAGYGSSTRRAGRSVADVVDDVLTVLDHVGADRVYVAGASGGGPHALACAALLPDRVRATATLASVTPYGDTGLPHDAFLADMGAENIEEFNAAVTGADALIGFLERDWPILRNVTGDEVAAALGDLVDDVDRNALTGDVAEWTAAGGREALREGFWGWFDDDMAFVRPWGFDLTTIEGPVHVWQGRHDRMVPFAHGEWLAGHIPTAIPHLSETDGHLTLALTSMDRILDGLIASGR